MASGGSSPVVARAYVAIIPTTKDAQKNIAKSLIPQLDSAGKSGGEALSGGIASSLKSASSKLASVAKIALAGAGVAAVKAFTSEVVSAYSDWEQLSGGVETIFGEATAQTVITNAKKAFSSVQMSANDYLDTVTSFSASLIQSLGGDTDKAAAVADVAIQDMADNANKMGTSIDSIRYAYQGFSRGTFTMLDNLKLGYGGTQEEMLRLVHDAGIVDQSITDISEVSFDQMIQSIHVIQERLGLAGASALEAATTLEGSSNMMKASWQNLLVAIGTGSIDEIQTSMQNFSSSVIAYASNLIPRIASIFVGIFTGLPSALATAGRELPAAMSKIITDTRDVIMKSSIGDAIRDMMSSQVVEKIKAAGTKVSDAFAGVLGGVDLGGKLQGAFDFITKSVAPQILEHISHLIEHIVSLALPLGQSLMTLFGHLWSVVEKIAAGIAEAFGGAFSDASDSLSGKMIPAAELMDRIFAAIERKITLLTDMISSISNVIDTTLDIIDALIAGDTETASQLVDGLVADIKDAFLAAFAYITTPIQGALKIVKELFGEDITKPIEDAFSTIESVINYVLGNIDFAQIIRDVASTISEVVMLIHDTIASIDASEVIATTQDALRGGLATAIEMVRTGIDAIRDLLERIKNSAVVQYLAALFSEIGRLGVAIFDSVVAVIVDLLWPILKEIWAFLSESLFPNLLALVGPVSDFVLFLVGVLADIFEKVSQIVPVIADILMPVIHTIFEFIGGMMGPVEKLLEFVLTALTDIVGWIGQLISSLVDFLLPIISAIVAFLTPVLDSILKAIVEIADTVVSSVSELWKQHLEPFVSLVIGLVSGLFATIGKFLSDHQKEINAVLGFLGKLIGDLVKTVGSTVSGLVSGITKIVGGLVSVVRNVFSLIISIVTGDVNGIRNSFAGLVNAISNIFWGVFDIITSPFRAAFNEIRRLWNSTIGGFRFTVPDWIPAIGGAGFQIPYLASGGVITGTGTVLVGEKGPELLNLPTGATVRPLSASDSSATSGPTFNVQVGDVNLSDDDEVRRITRAYLEQLARIATPGGLVTA
jgi:phage-related protein